MIIGNCQVITCKNKGTPCHEMTGAPILCDNHWPEIKQHEYHVNNAGIETVPVAATERLGLGTRFIPSCADEREGAIWLEGAEKYGQDNWKWGVSNEPWQMERWEHARRHLNQSSQNGLITQKG